MTNAEDILKEAARLVSGPRAETHGDKLQDFEAIAKLWNAIIRIKVRSDLIRLDAHDVGCMMELMKIARRYTGAYNLDDYIDGAGYAACACEVRVKMETQE